VRIAVFIKSTTFNQNYGGLETQNKLLCEGLAEAGHSISIISPLPENFDVQLFVVNENWNVTQEGGFFRIVHTTLDLTYYFLDAPSGKYSKQWFQESLRVFRKLREKRDFDAVISQSMAGQGAINYLKTSGSGTPAQGETSGVSTDLTPEVRELGRLGNSLPVCIVIQHGTILGELKTRWNSLPAPRKTLRVPGTRRVGELARVLKAYLFFFFRLIPYGIKIYIQDQIRLRKADRVIAVSDLVKESLVSEYFLPEEKVAVVYNGIEIGKFDLPAGKAGIRKSISDIWVNNEIGEEDKVLLYVGRVEKEKGLGKLLEAVSNFKFEILNFKLVIVGDGPYLADLKKLVKELDIADKVIFTGKVSYERVPKYYAAADVFVLPSLRQEGLPMTLPEAMASGLPVVVSRIGGIPNAVRDGETGLLVEPGNVDELSRALNDILNNDALASDMGENAQELAKDRFSQEAMVEKTLVVIRNIVGS